MDAKAFLSTVVPWTDGYATIHWQAPGKNKPFLGQSCKTVDEAVELVRQLKGKRVNIYFCLSRQRFNSGQRSRAGATEMNALWLEGDVDPNNPKAFPTLKDAVVGIIKFCDGQQIPRPSLIVRSGTGVHAYLLSNRDLPVEDWQPYADALINAVKVAGLTIKDIGVTGDAARVLRVPGTLNYKYDPPQPVEVLTKWSTLERHDFSMILARMKELAPAGPKRNAKLRLGPLPDAFKHLLITPLGRGIPDPPPLPFAPIRKGCAWLREAFETGGKNMTGNMQWNLLTLCATWMENGNELAHQLVNQHPGYDFQSTEGLWDRKIRERRDKDLGWPRCRTVSDSGCGHCKSCPNFIFDKSPLHLGLGASAASSGGGAKSSSNGSKAYAEDQKADGQKGQSQIDIEEEIKNLGGRRPKEARLPEGFAIDEEGRICGYIASDVKKNTPPRLLHILKTQIKDPTLQHQNGQFGLGFTASTDRGNWHEVFLPSANNTVELGLVKALANKFVIHNPDPEAKKMLDQFPASWIDLLRQEDVATRDSGTMGWRYEDGEKIGFVFGNTLYHESGEERQLVAVADNEFRSHYQPVGKKEVWLKACKLLTDRKRPELDILIAIGFAAPLMVFAGTLYGATLSVWGEPGTSKSTAQQVAAAIFGHPKQTREALTSTPKSVMRRLGLCRNLAAYWDDIQDERHQEGLFQTMFVAAGGAEGGRLNTDATMKERLEWQTLLVACSNASFVEYLVKKQKSTTAGIRRVFEFEYNRNPNEPGMINAMAAGQIFAELEHNYGVVGAEYAKLLATEHPQIKALVISTMNAFTEAVNGSSEETFWWGICGVILTGAALGNRLGAEFDLVAMNDFLQKAFLENRRLRDTEGTDSGTYGHTEMALVNFMNHYVGAGHCLWVAKAYGHRGMQMNILNTMQGNRQIVVQIARDENTIYFSKKMFRDYLYKAEINVRQVYDGLAKHFKAKEIKVTLGAGTSLAHTQESCFMIKVPNNPKHPLHEVLCAQGAPKYSVP